MSPRFPRFPRLPSHRLPDPSQASLFDDPNALIATEMEAVSVPIDVRAQQLIHSMTFLAQASQRQGMIEAAETPHRRGMEGRYGSSLPSVLGGVAVNADKSLAEAKHQFEYASGYLALASAGVVDEDTAKKLAGAEFSDFRGHFAGSDNRAARDRYRKQLERNLKQK